MACKGKGSRTLKAIDVNPSAAGLFAEAEDRPLPRSRCTNLGAGGVTHSDGDDDEEEVAPAAAQEPRERRRANVTIAENDEDYEGARADEQFDKLKEAIRGAPKDVKAALLFLRRHMEQLSSDVALLSNEKEQLVEQNVTHTRERAALEKQLKSWTKAFRQREEEIAQLQERNDGLLATNEVLRKELKGMAARQRQRRREEGEEEEEVPEVVTPMWKRKSADPKPAAEDKSPASRPKATSSPSARKTPPSRAEASRSPARAARAAEPAAATSAAPQMTAPIAAVVKRREEKAAAAAGAAPAKAKAKAKAKATAGAGSKRAAASPSAASRGSAAPSPRGSVAPSPKRSRASPAASVSSKSAAAAAVAEESAATRMFKPSRPRIKWTMGEVAALEQGVAKYGMHWTYILEKYKFHEQRTSVDLKDKWRNLNKGL